MKSCPTCSRTFEDTFTFCLADGSLLNAPFDPQATLVIPEPIQIEQQPTELLKLEATKQKIPPTDISPSPTSRPKSEDNLTETQRLQLEYWTAFRDFLLQSKSFLKYPKPQPQNWLSISIGSSNFGLVATVHRKGGRICAYFVFYGANAKPHYHLLKKDKEAVADEVGEPLEWRELPKGKESQIRLCKHETDLENRLDWEAQHEWLKEKLELFHQVFAPRIKNLNVSEYVSEAIEETKPEISPTIASLQPEQKPEELISTIAAPAPAFETPEIKDSPAPPVLKPNRSPLIMAGVGALLIIGLVYFIAINRTGSTSENSNRTSDATANMTRPSVATSSNSNQTSNAAATPASSPSPTPVVTLEGTVWHLITTVDSRDYENAALEFKQNGRIIDHGVKMEDGNWRYNTRGKWTRQGDIVSMDFPTDPYFNHYKYEGTIQGEEITGSIDFFGEQANGTFRARLIK